MAKTYTLEEFLDQFSYSPIDIFEVAEEAAKVSDDKDFVKAAKALEKARMAFDEALAERGFEWG